MALYARVEWPWFALGWVGLVPWLTALDRRRSLGGALGAGLVMCVAFNTAVFSWFATAIQNYTGAPWPFALFVVALLSPLMQPQLIAFAATRHLARRAGAPAWHVALAGAGVYVGIEWTGPKLFADTLGHGFFASPLLRQAADIAGAGGLTFVLLLANDCALAALRAAHAPRRLLAPVGCGAALVAVLAAYGAVRLAQLDGEDRAAPHVTAAIVQADISRYDRLAGEIGTFAAVRSILDAHFSLSDAALAGGGIDLLVWPETVYPTTFGAPKSADGAAFDREIVAFVARAGVPLVFGSYDAEDGAEYNAAMALAPRPDGRLELAAYRKALLFPLTERVPAWLDSALVRGWLPWLGTWKPGTGEKVLRLALPGGRALSIAPLICYDAVEPRLAIAAVRAGAELIVTLSNDSWFAAGGGPRLHLVVSAFRSLETRRAQVRATNTGISAVITPTGALLGTLDVHRRDTLVAAVTPRRGAGTLMLAWGDWFGRIALGLGLLMLGAARFTASPGSRFQR